MLSKKANIETSTFNSLRLLPDEEDKYILVCVTLRCTVKIELVFNYFETMPLSHPLNEVLNFMGTSVSKSTAAPESACRYKAKNVIAHIC